MVVPAVVQWLDAMSRGRILVFEFPRNLRMSTYKSTLGHYTASIFPINSRACELWRWDLFALWRVSSSCCSSCLFL